MKRRIKRSWNWQIHTIEVKGASAFAAGVPLTDNPYTTGYRNQNGPGGNLQRQRSQAWVRGWQNAEREQKENHDDPG